MVMLLVVSIFWKRRAFSMKREKSMSLHRPYRSVLSSFRKALNATRLLNKGAFGAGGVRFTDYESDRSESHQASLTCKS